MAKCYVLESFYELDPYDSPYIVGVFLRMPNRALLEECLGYITTKQYRRFLETKSITKNGLVYTFNVKELYG